MTSLSVEDIDDTSVDGRSVNVPYIRVEARTLARDALRRLPERLIRGRKVLPLALKGEPGHGSLVVAMRDPRDLATLDEVRFAAGIPIQPVLASESEIDEAIEMLFGNRFQAASQTPSDG
ncbi:MAG TPA: hypothetical protein VMK12_17820 [Anaeromyxobacteraceae bacterium]|nr:hypothetical protein [Anaeromyxobacteraceae bacterium]